MSSYYLPVTKHEAEDGVTLTARTPGGRIFASAGGETYAKAVESLKLLVNETLAGRVEDGYDPFTLLRHGEPSPEDVIFHDTDLFPVILRRLRRSKGLTQEQVARRMNITQSAYSKLEQFGINPKLDTLRRLKDALASDFFQFNVAS